MKNKNKAIILMLIVALGFALMRIFVKLSGDLPSVQKSFYRNFVRLLVLVWECLLITVNLIKKSINKELRDFEIS